MNIYNVERDVFLASKSPRRKEILDSIDFKYEILSLNGHDEFSDLKDPGKYAEAISLEKAEAAAEQVGNGIIITADTIVYQNGEILEKPIDRQEGFTMLSKLSNVTHQVFSAMTIAVIPEGVYKTFHEVTDVTFAALTDEQINWYLDTGEYGDKAGAYAIQGKGAMLINKINGCYFNVVGLPLNKFVVEYNKILEDLE